jgi:hypothetical protein
MATKWLCWQDFIKQRKSENRGKLIDLTDNPLPVLACGKWVVFQNPEFTKLVVDMGDNAIEAQAWHEKFKSIGHSCNMAFAENKLVNAYMHRPVCTNYSNRILTFWFVNFPAYPKGFEPKPKLKNYD